MMQRSHWVITGVDVDGHKLHRFPSAESACAFAASQPFGVVDAVYDMPAPAAPDMDDPSMDYLMRLAGVETFIARE